MPGVSVTLLASSARPGMLASVVRARVMPGRIGDSPIMLAETFDFRGVSATEPAALGGRTSLHIYLYVPDVDTLAAACGVTHIHDNPWAREFEVKDPDGNRIRVGTVPVSRR